MLQTAEKLLATLSALQTGYKATCPECHAVHSAWHVDPRMFVQQLKAYGWSYQHGQWICSECS